jgi:hypothetical protein
MAEHATEHPPTESSPISLVQEIERVDAISSSLFEVLMALGAAALALVFAVDVLAVRLAGVVLAVVVGITALTVVPDVVFAQRQPDRSDDSLRAYLKYRQRGAQRGLLVVLTVAWSGYSAGLGYAAALLTEDTGFGILLGAIGAAVCLIGAIIDRKETWPREIRGRR